ncbi:MAG: ABC transporter permease [Candidatus Kapaibacterium sp.]
MSIFSFELRYWLRQPSVYVFLLVIAVLIFGATVTDEISVGGSLGNVHRNAPYVIENYYGLMSILCLLMITTFMNGAAARDFTEKTSQVLFSTPVRKRDLLVGRFLGALTVSIIPFLGVSLGVLIGSVMPWVDPERMGPVFPGAHLHGIIVFVIPNLAFAGSIIFSIAAFTRSTMLSFLGSIGLLVGYSIALTLVGDIDNEFLDRCSIPSAYGPLGSSPNTGRCRIGIPCRWVSRVCCYGTVVYGLLSDRWSSASRTRASAFPKRARRSGRRQPGRRSPKSGNRGCKQP